MMRYDWSTGGYDYLQAFGMTPRNSAVAGYMIAKAKPPCTILDSASGLCPIVPFLPKNIFSHYFAFDNSDYVQEHLPYKEIKNFEFHRLTYEEFFSYSAIKHNYFDFVLYLGMYGGYDVYADRLKKLLPYKKPDGYLILEAIDEHIEEVLLVMKNQYPDYKEIASCNIQVQEDSISHLNRERFRSIHVWIKKLED